MRGCPFVYSGEVGALVKVHGEAGAGGQEREAQEEHASKENARREGVHESAQGAPSSGIPSRAPVRMGVAMITKTKVYFVRS